MKVLIFDSSSLINFVMNGSTDILVSLKKEFDGKFIIPHSVKREIIDRPIKIKQYELGALKAKFLMDKKIIELPESIGLDHNYISEISQVILKGANKVFSTKNEFLHIIHEGEASCLALSIIAKEKGIENVVVIDERTTRMLGERPENLKKLFEKKFHTNIKMSEENLPKINKIKFIRSSELMYIAWKKKLISLDNEKVLDALLYATKYKGASISSEEIEEIENLP